MKKHFLPILTPDFICYPPQTNANAIIRALAKDKSKILLCSKNINCYYEEKSENYKFVISINDHWCMNQKFMQRQYISFLKETYMTERKKLISMVRKLLLHNCYIFCHCNPRYIDSNIISDTSDYECIVSGFDDIRRTFLLHGIYKNQYVNYNVQYRDFLNSIFATEYESISLTIWRCKENYSYDIDIADIIFEISDYLKSQNSRKEYTVGKVYGLASIVLLRDSFVEDHKNGLNLNEAYLKKYAIHKKYMRERIETLTEMAVIDSKWESISKRIEEIGETVLSLGLEYNATRDSALIERIYHYISDSVEIESRYLPSILEEIVSNKHILGK